MCLLERHAGEAPVADRLIVTAASPAFGPSLLALLGSLNANWPRHPPVAVYDLGLDRATTESLAAFAVAVRPVEAFCAHWRRHFAWKVWCLCDAPARDVLWMDAGMAVLEPLEEAFDAVDALGYFAVATYGRLVEQAPAAAVRACGLSRDFAARRATLAGSLIGLRKEGAGLAVLREARELVLDERNVAAGTPAHRHDQALLSLLLYKHHGRVVACDQGLYLNWRSPRDAVGQKVWHHRRAMCAADVAFLSRQTRPWPSGRHVPRSPPRPAAVARAWTAVRAALRAPARRLLGVRPEAVYDGVRDPPAEGAGEVRGEPVRLRRLGDAIVGVPFFPPGSGPVEDADAPDVIAVHTGSGPASEIYRQIRRARFRHGWRPLVYAHYGEIHVPAGPNRRNVDYAFSFAPTSRRNCRHERYLTMPVLAPHIEARRERRADSLWAAPKTEFCNFVYSNGSHGRVDVRERFARDLMAVGRVDCPGARLTNHARLPPYGTGEGGGVLAKLAFLARYRFTIAFENASADGYVTEKIVHALAVGSIPVYWGCPRIADYYNPDSFVNCHDYPSFDAVVERVREIDADPALAEAYRQAPMLLPTSRIHGMHRDLRDRHRRLVDEALERRVRREGAVGKWLRCAAFVARNAPLEGRLHWGRARRLAGRALRRAGLRR